MQSQRYSRRGKYGCYTSEYALRNIACKASDIHEEESMDVVHPNTDWRNITDKTCDVHVEESLEVKLPNTDRCNTAGEASGMRE